MQVIDKKPQQHKFGAIDALRGVAALSVVLYHLVAGQAFHLNAPPWTHRLLFSGACGVTLFFVISAFTLAYSGDERSGSPHSIASFYVRRIFRIVPLFLAIFAFYVLYDKFIFHTAHRWIEYVVNLTFTFNFVPGLNEGIVWASWTLGVEMVFYALFPLLFGFARTLNRTLIFLVVSVTVAMIWQYYFVPKLVADPVVRGSFGNSSFLRHLPSFACGFVLFQLYKTSNRREVRSVVLPLLSLLAGVCLWMKSVYYAEGRDLGFVFFLRPVSLVLITYFLLWLPGRWVTFRVTRFFGEISYSLYLLHPIIVFRVLPPFYRWMYAQGLGDGISFACCALATVSVLTGLAALTYNFIEKPGIRFGSMLVRRYLSRPDPVAKSGSAPKTPWLKGA